MKLFLLGIYVLLLSISGGLAHAAGGVTIHAAEWGVGKFHRYANQVHPYPAQSAWLPYVLPAKAQFGPAVTVSNHDGSYTIFFSTLDELIENSTQIATSVGKPIQVFNLLAHGLPGTMWYPPTKNFLNSIECYSWKSAAAGSDQAPYNQYYSAISEADIMQIRAFSESPSPVGCTTGLPEWRRAIQAHPEFIQALATDVQIHFLSCVVGLGKAGQAFTQGMAELLLANKSGQIQTSVNFGLGDWSMPEGMGFWDFINSEQMKHDNEVYPKNKMDREVMQKGTIRTTVRTGQGWSTQLWGDQMFMSLGFVAPGIERTILDEPDFENLPRLGEEILIPGTQIRSRIQK